MKRLLLLLLLAPLVLSAQTALSGNKLTLSKNNTPLPAGLTGTISQAAQIDGTNTRSLLDGFGAATILDGRRSGGSNSSKTAIASGSVMLRAGGLGYGTTAYSIGERSFVNFTASENWTDTAQGAIVEIGTTPAGFTTTVVSHTFSPAGLTFNLTAQRILGDFTNDTLSNRVIFQTTTANEKTVLGVMPSGSGTVSATTYYASSDPANAPYIYILASQAGHVINSSESGTGTVQSVAIQIDGTPRLTVKTSGIINLSNTPNYASNAAAISGGLVAGDIYRNGDALQIVH